MKNILRKGFDLAKRLVKRNLGKKIGKMEVENALAVYNKGVSKIKRQRIEKMLLSNLGNSALDMGRAYV